MEFHVSRTARDRYRFDLSIYNLRGNVVFANFYAARSFADRMNAKRDLVRFPEQVVRPGKLNAMGLIDEILHVIIQQYVNDTNPNAIKGAIAWVESHVGKEEFHATLRQFTEEFPPIQVYRKEMTADEYLVGESDGVSNVEIATEELVALWLANNNPAFSPFIELFDDSNIKAATAYRAVLNSMQQYFGDQPTFGPGGSDLLDLLSTPARLFPHSLEEQLAYLLEKWGTLLERYVYRILSSLDLVKEEEKANFFGPGPTEIPDYQQIETEPEQFSEDLDWMPEVVLIAKNVYVWLHQLSIEYNRPISRLDQIPGEELEKLRRWGLTGLWLIGLWERSRLQKK